MEKNGHTFLHALKLWLIWNVLVDLSLAIIIGGTWQAITAADHSSGQIFAVLLFPVLSSQIAGLIQWLAFIHRIKHSYLWILTTALGYALGWIVIIFGYYYSGFLFKSSESFIILIGIGFLAGSISGLLIGWPQYWVLRGKVSGAGLWLEASFLGWACAVCAANVLGQSSMGMVGVVVGLSFMGMITGVAYAYLFSQPGQSAPYPR